MKHSIHLSRSLSGLLLIIAVALSSCNTSKYVYLKDLEPNLPQPITQTHQTHIKSGDRLDIHVTCSKRELALPFNNLTYSVSADGSATASEAAAPKGYLVDNDGYIEFPTLGRLHLAGLTLPQASDYIKGLLVEGRHIPDAIVETSINNFTIYGLGALAPGKLVIPSGEINILQAVAQMGDLQNRANINKVRVIREEDGQRVEYDINMQSVELYNSPAFFLQQNDIVYAEPRKRTNQAFNTSSTVISIIAVLASLAYSLTYMFR